MGIFEGKMADKTEKINLIDRLERFSKNHPFIFWGGSLAWIILPFPIDFIPIIDDILLTIILSLVGFKKLK